MNMRPQLSDAQRLAAIRADLAAVESRAWVRVEDGEGGFVEASCDGFWRSSDGRFVRLRFDPSAADTEKQFVADALENIRFLLKLVDRAIDKMRPPESQTPPAGPIHDDPKNYAAEAGMLCGNTAFKVFLAERHGLEKPMTDDRTAQKLRSLLSVTSRKDLNSDDRAAAGWKKLRGEFYQWKRHQR
jgi:hypothetical protein